MFGAEKLLQDPTKIQLQEGPFLSNTIASIKQLIQTSSNLAFFNYQSSNATKLMQDEFGGNCFTRIIINLNASQSPILNYQVLEMFEGLREMMCAPVVNNENVVCLFSLFRVKIIMRI